MLENQQCSYQYAASVLCRAGLETFVGKLFLHFSNACPTTFLRRKCSDKQCQVLSSFAYQEHTQQLELCLCIKKSRWASDPFSHEICQRKDHQWAYKNPIIFRPTGQTPKTSKNHLFFAGSHGLITIFFTGKLRGFEKLFLFFQNSKVHENTGLVRGKYGISTGTCSGPHVFTIAGA